MGSPALLDLLVARRRVRGVVDDDMGKLCLVYLVGLVTIIMFADNSDLHVKDVDYTHL
jgi:hypothetical protein